MDIWVYVGKKLVEVVKMPQPEKGIVGDGFLEVSVRERGKDTTVIVMPQAGINGGPVLIVPNSLLK